jgi:outer membrane immunogenic protein
MGLEIGRWLQAWAAAGALGVCLIAPAQAQTTGGFRIGAFAQGNYQDASVDEIEAGGGTTLPAFAKLIASSGPVTGSLNSISGGGSLGFDWLVNKSWLLGIEADLSKLGGHASGLDHQWSTDGMATVRGRLGYVVSDALLVYMTGGYAAMRATYVGSAPPPVLSSDVSKTMSGWTIGGGVETGWQRVKVFGEYLYTDVGSWTLTNTGGDTYTFDSKSHTLRLGVKLNLSP